MKFETVRIHFLSEDFRFVTVAVEVASCFFLFCFVLFPDRHFFCQLLVNGINSMLMFFC